MSIHQIKAQIGGKHLLLLFLVALFTIPHVAFNSVGAEASESHDLVYNHHSNPDEPVNIHNVGTGDLVEPPQTHTPQLVETKDQSEVGVAGETIDHGENQAQYYQDPHHIPEVKVEDANEISPVNPGASESPLESYKLEDDNSQNLGASKSPLESFKLEDDNSQVTTSNVVFDKKSGIYDAINEGKPKADCAKGASVEKEVTNEESHYHDNSSIDPTPQIVARNDNHVVVGEAEHESYLPYVEDSTQAGSYAYETPVTPHPDVNYVYVDTSDKTPGNVEAPISAQETHDNDSLEGDATDAVSYAEMEAYPPTEAVHPISNVEMVMPAQSNAVQDSGSLSRVPEHRISRRRRSSAMGSTPVSSVKVTPQPDTYDPSISPENETSPTKRGKAHDVRTPNYWIESNPASANLESCKALSNEDNLSNPFLYMSNLARCQDNIQTALTWDKNLERDATDLAHAMLDFIMDYSPESIKSLAVVPDAEHSHIQRTNGTSTPVTEVSDFSAGAQTIINTFLGGNPHIPIPYMDKNNTRTLYSTGQSILIGQMPFGSVVNQTSGGQTHVYYSTKCPSMYNMMNGDIHFDDVEFKVKDLLVNNNDGNQMKVREYLNQVHDLGADGQSLLHKRQFPSLEEQFPEIVNQIEKNSLIYTADMEALYPLLFLRSEYLGGPRTMDEVLDMSMSATEYSASMFFINMYLREGETVRKRFGSKEAFLSSNLELENLLQDHNVPIGHYSQLVWASSNEVGCGTVHKNANFMTVCAYYPAGNVSKQIPNDPSNIQTNSVLSLSDREKAIITQNLGGYIQTTSIRRLLYEYYVLRYQTRSAE